MLPIVKFNALIIALTVGAMFVAVPFLAPIIKQHLVPQIVTDWAGPAGANAFKFAVGFLGAATAYSILFNVLEWLIGKSTWVKKKVLGSYYIEGTWGGFYGTGEAVQCFVDIFEQSLTGFCVRGLGYKVSSGQTVPDVRATWKSSTTYIDADNGTINFYCQVELLVDNSTCDTVSKFSMIRNKSGPPVYLFGDSANLTAGGRKQQSTRTRSQTGPTWRPSQLSRRRRTTGRNGRKAHSLIARLAPRIRTAVERSERSHLLNACVAGSREPGSDVIH
jgi:hypothetical protein